MDVGHDSRTRQFVADNPADPLFETGEKSYVPFWVGPLRVRQRTAQYLGPGD